MIEITYPGISDLDIRLIGATTVEETEYFIKIGACVSTNAKDDYGYTALVRAETEDQARILLEAGANIDAKNINGYKAIHFCYHDLDQLKVLIEQNNAKGPADLGRLMGIASKHFAGKADNKVVSQLLKQMLG